MSILILVSNGDIQRTFRNVRNIVRNVRNVRHVRNVAEIWERRSGTTQSTGEITQRRPDCQFLNDDVIQMLSPCAQLPPELALCFDVTAGTGSHTERHIRRVLRQIWIQLAPDLPKIEPKPDFGSI